MTTTTPSQGDERRAFEAFVARDYIVNSFTRAPDGYVSGVAHRARHACYADLQILWEVWQAARALSAARPVAQEAILAEAARWLHAAYDRPPITPECKGMLDRIDAALAASHPPVSAEAGKGVDLKLAEDLAKLGWQTVVCDLCGQTARGFPSESVAVSGEVSDAPRAFDAFLCKAWGESDLPSAELVTDWAGVERFMVREWLGEEDATDGDGELTLPRVKAEFDEHDADCKGAEFTIGFEIGGVSIQRVCGFAVLALAGSGGKA